MASLQPALGPLVTLGTAPQVGSSRDDSFRDLVLRETNGVGVDCVLNSLSGALLG